MIENKNCAVCEGEEWEGLDSFRDQMHWYKKDIRLLDEPVGMKICKTCGYMTYDWLDDKRLADIYDLQRKGLGHNHMTTCARKNKYHEAFLKELPDYTIMEYIEKRKILDVGCAQGSFLNYLKIGWNVPLENLYGTEYAKAFRDFAKYEYGLNITQDIDESIKYDFISYYHVLEHIQNPREALMKCRDLLTDDGILYISVPTWFSTLEETSGVIADSFEEYFHLNHICVFTDQSFENLLKATGWEITKSDKVMYGYTVLCKKVKPSNDIVKEDYKKIIKLLKTTKEAIAAFNKKDYDKCLKLWPKYPDAYLYYTLTSENMKDLDKQMVILDEGLELMPGCIKILDQQAKLLFQWDETNSKNPGFYSNNIKEAEKLFNHLIEVKPGLETSHFFMGLLEATYKKDFDKACWHMKEVIAINQGKWSECMGMVAQFRKEQGNE